MTIVLMVYKLNIEAATNSITVIALFKAKIKFSKITTYYARLFNFIKHGTMDLNDVASSRILSQLI